MATCRKLFDEKALKDSHTHYVADTDSSDSTAQIHALSSIRKPSPPTQTLNPHSSAPRKRNMDSKPFTQKKKKKKTKTKTEEVEADSNVAGDALGDADSDYVPIEENTSATLIKRVFSLSDEISILQHLIAHRKENGSDPTSNMPSFYTYIQQAKALHLYVTQTQLSKKIRSLKKKFEKYAEAVPPDPSQTHECLLFELSTKVWGQCKRKDTRGSEVNALSEIKLTDEVMSVLKKVIKIDEQYVDFEAMYPYMASALEREGGKEEMMKKWRSIGAEVLEKMEDELKELVRLELKVRRQSLQVLNKLHTKLLGD